MQEKSRRKAVVNKKETWRKCSFAIGVKWAYLQLLLELKDTG
jgi:hypothetical protein